MVLIEQDINLVDVGRIVDEDLGELGRGTDIKVFHPANYILQMIDSFIADEEVNFDGLENDLEAVVAETILESELRRVEYEVEINDGRLFWPAPGHEGRGGGTVLDMTKATVERYRELGTEKAGIMAERFAWEYEQLEGIIKKLEVEPLGGWVLAVLPNNEAVYPVTSINYLTIYRLEYDGEGYRVVSYPFMNRYTKRLLRCLWGELRGKGVCKEEMTEEELITTILTLNINDPKEIFLKAESLVLEEESLVGRVGVWLDRTKDVESCREPVIKPGAEFLKKILNYEWERLEREDNWLEVRERLNVAWELVAKNIYAFVNNEKFLEINELMEQVEWYKDCIERGGFSRGMFLREIVMEKDMQILAQPMVRMGACGSLELPGLDGSMGSDPVQNLMNRLERGKCCVCGGEPAVCGYCDGCKHLAPSG